MPLLLFRAVASHCPGEAAGGVTRPTLVLYPMKCPNRAAERRPEIISVLRQSGYERVIDMTGHEKHDKAYFEGTGEGLWRMSVGVLSMVLLRGSYGVSICETCTGQC
jgi:hypothetical protein